MTTYRIEKSGWLTLIGIIVLFSTAIIAVLIYPNYVDPSWTKPSSYYQVQMYEISDPNIYIGTSLKGGQTLQFVQRLQKGYTLLAFQENETTRFTGPAEFEPYITKMNDSKLKLTSRLLLTREPSDASEKRLRLQKAWEEKHPNWEKEELLKPYFEVLEIYDPNQQEAFVVATPDQLVQNYVDKDYEILDPSDPYHHHPGVIYAVNPREFRLSRYSFNGTLLWKYDPEGTPLKGLQELEGHELNFRSKKELISFGEHLFAIEGCWYCHTDQTRTLVQDVVLNGSAEYPAPPSSPNEYIYQKITFPGTRRIGPDISRVGIKRPGRDWHKGHFWSPKTTSKGSVMPAFRHFFDDDPRGTDRITVGIPNYRFEAIFQYLMTKGTRITPPTQSWWLGKDPVDTKAIIEGKRG